MLSPLCNSLLATSYGATRLEQACLRAIHFNSVNAPTIKTILKESLDHHSLDLQESFDQLGSAYQGNGIYQRQTSESRH